MLSLGRVFDINTPIEYRPLNHITYLSRIYSSVCKSSGHVLVRMTLRSPYTLSKSTRRYSPEKIWQQINIIQTNILRILPHILAFLLFFVYGMGAILCMADTALALLAQVSMQCKIYHHESSIFDRNSN